MPADAIRSPGRPRIRPEDAVPLSVPVSAAERERINAAAERAGLSAAQWMRQVILKAANEILRRQK